MCQVLSASRPKIHQEGLIALIALFAHFYLELRKAPANPRLWERGTGPVISRGGQSVSLKPHGTASPTGETTNEV
jgi:hypothetical protein